MQPTDSEPIFTFEQSDHVLIVNPSRDMSAFRDVQIRDAYNETYRRICDPKIAHLLFDFSASDYFGSTFVGIMIRLARKMRLDGGDAALCSLNENLSQMLKSLMLLENPKADCYWSTYPDRAAALAGLTPGTD